LPYDKLVIATGSFAFVPPLPGRDRPNCFVYRTIEDLEAIRAAAATSKIGTVRQAAACSGWKCQALRDLKLETHVVEFAPRLMAVQLDDTGLHGCCAIALPPWEWRYTLPAIRRRSPMEPRRAMR